MLKTFWTAVFVLLCYLGYVYGKPYYDSYNETEEIYTASNFESGSLYKVENRTIGYKLLSEKCKLGVKMKDGQQFSCRAPAPKHIWEWF